MTVQDTNRRFGRATATRAVLTVALVLFGLAAVTARSLALFTDSAQADFNTFSTGTIDLTASPASAVVNMPAMVPGDQVTAPLRLTNSGSLDLRYAATSTTTEDVLAAELVLTVRSGVATCDDGNWNVGGTTLYSGVLGTVAGTPLFGSATPGADAGDRTLAPAAFEDLCLNVTFPIAATGGEGLSTTATLGFEAEQTANNP